MLADPNGLLFLRARYYSPALGVFPSLDPLETLNRYQYVGANPVNFADPTGMIMERPTQWDQCQQLDRKCPGDPPTTFNDCQYPNYLRLTTCPDYWGILYGRMCSNLRRESLITPTATPPQPVTWGTPSFTN